MTKELLGASFIGMIGSAADGNEPAVFVLLLFAVLALAGYLFLKNLFNQVFELIRKQDEADEEFLEQ